MWSSKYAIGPALVRPIWKQDDSGKVSPADSVARMISNKTSTSLNRLETGIAGKPGQDVIGLWMIVFQCQAAAGTADQTDGRGHADLTCSQFFFRQGGKT
jgi:hypothetical protein